MAGFNRQFIFICHYGLAVLVLVLGLLISWPGNLSGDDRQVRAVVLRNWPPQYQTGDYGQPAGFAIDTLNQVAALAGLDVVYEVVDTWEEAFDALKKGRADLIPNQGITAERKQWFAFTSPVETFPVVIFVRNASSDIQNSSDLAGHTVATVEYNIGTRLMQHFSGIHHKVFSNVNEALLELLAGHVDALIYPRPVIIQLAVKAGLEDRIKIVGAPLVEIKRAISVNKNNQGLLARLEPAVKKFVLSKEYKQIYSRWYGRRTPFWTPKRIVGLMIGVVFILVLWHSVWVTRSNRRLKKSVSEKDFAEAALYASEEKYRLIVENQTDLTIKMDADHRLLFASPSFCETFGISKIHLEGIHFLSLLHRRDIEQVKLAMQSLQVIPHTCRHEGRALTPRGWQWFSWSNKAIFGSDGKIKEIISVGRNTTERKTAEVQLQESEERFRAIFEQAADAVVLLNRETLAMAEFNSAAHQALGYTQEEFSVIHLPNIIVPAPGRTLKAALARVLDSRQHPVEMMLRARSGQVRYFLARQRPLNVQGGQFLLGIWHDITERKMLEEHLVQSQKMEAIGTLAGGVSHDFNNILSIILGNIEMAMMDVAQGHPVMRRLKEIQTAGLRAREVVRQLLSFSRKEEEHRLSVLLAPLIEESLQLLRASIPKTIKIRKDLYNKDLAILADATQIHQVLINLCTNAAQAINDDGGTIDVSLASVVPDQQACRGYKIKPGQYARIRIKDTGCGMAPETIERIFDPYYTTKKGRGGTGMGLSIVHGIISRHDGIIDVEESRPGCGTTFKVMLPLSEAQIPEKEEVADEVITGNERILFVDDEAPIATIGRQYLSKLGYQIQAFTSAVKALAAFKAAPSQFDLIITDMSMPEMTGKVLSGRILNIRSDIPIIMCSGYHRNTNELDDSADDISLYLQKPYNMKALADAVRRVISESITR